MDTSGGASLSITGVFREAKEMNHRRITRFVFTTVSVLAALAILFALVVASSQIDIPGPAGSGSFGSSVTVLPNGNLVICDPGYDAGSTVDVGAAYLYDGADGTLISKLTGSTANDWICTYGVIVLANGNYLVRSPYWDNGAVADAGAVTWGDGETGISGTVSAANSLVGNSPGDQIGFYVDLLANGNYVVHSSIWDNGSVADAGAVTWGNGATGITGPVSAANSLVGSSPYDQIGNYVDLLANGNYLVISPLWDNGPAADAGVVTWGNGSTGISGPVSPANSLVGSSPDDQVGYLGVTALSNGNYVVNSPYWDNGEAVDAGAVTWGDGATGITGLVSAANSLAGSTASDQVGASYYQECTKTECHEVIVNNVSVLSNGNYVVNSPYWDNRAAADVGAVTWGNGTTGVAGTVSAANSLVGSTAYDQVGSIILPREGTVNSVDVLANGNYVVKSLLWDNGEAIDAGAVTWGDGANGTYG
jgi:hypothetical protein